MTGGGRRPSCWWAVPLTAVALLASACRTEEPAPAETDQPAVAAVAEPAPRPLAAGDRYEGVLHDGVSHVYLLHLAAGRWLRVTATQPAGKDLFLRVVGPDGAETTGDRPMVEDGDEEVLVVGEGTHRLSVELYLTEQPQGAVRYEIAAETGAVDETTPTRLDAERACQRAWGLWVTTDAARRESALRDFERCAEGLGAVGDDLRQARALTSLGRALQRWGGPAERQVEALRRAGELWAAHGETEDELSAKLWLGFALSAGDRPEEAIEVLRPLVERFAAAGRIERQVLAMGQLGHLYSNQGRWDDALDVLESAERSAGGLPPSCAQMNRLGNWAVTLRRIGAYDRARPLLDEAIATYAALSTEEERKGCVEDLSVLLYRRGEISLADRDFEAAAGYAARAVEMAGDDHRALTRTFQGQVAVAAGELDLAAEALTEARRLYAAGDDRKSRRSVAVCDASLGDLAAAQDRLDAAVASYRRALDFAAAHPDPLVESHARLGLARTLMRQGDLDAARRTLEEALEVVEGMRGERAGAELRAKLLASQSSRYDLLVEVLMRQGRAAEALHACERARARSLLDTLSGGFGEPSDEARRLRARLGQLEDQRWNADAEQEAGLRAEIDRTALELDRERGRALPPADPAVVLTAAEIRRHLDEDSLLLSFHLGDERSYLWVVDRERVDGYVLPPRGVIEASAAEAYGRLASGSSRWRRQTRAAMRQLSEELLSPAAGRLGGGEKLLVVPEGGLHYVPFAALPLPGDDRLLLDAHETVVLPSASTLARQRRRLAGREPADGELVAVADPVFSPDDERLSDLPAAPRSGRRSGSLRRLPYTAAEVEHILELVPEGRGTRVLSGFEATAGAIRGGGLSGYRYVHLATHALLSGDEPQLVLSLYAADGSPDRRGWLHRREIYDLDLPAELVVLSACSTGLGEEIDGEGLVGFTQGFLYAGARRLMVSLWDVGDESTADLMRLFYSGLLARGLPPATALREAQLAMERDGRPLYDWAGFVLQGEPR